MCRKITAEYFEQATGYAPVQDDLERSNCPKAGQMGHAYCGWCDKCNRPVFACGCDLIQAHMGFDPNMEAKA